MEVVKGNPQKGVNQKGVNHGDNNHGGKNTTNEQKLNYEQLNNACNQLWQQNQQLIKRNAELEQFSMFKRLDYLFKVLEYKENFSSDFVISCTGEIEDAMTIPQKENEISKESQK